MINSYFFIQYLPPTAVVDSMHRGNNKCRRRRIYKKVYLVRVLQLKKKRNNKSNKYNTVNQKQQLLDRGCCTSEYNEGTPPLFLLQY